MALFDSFMVKLGFEVNPDEEAKFKGSTESATKRIKSMGKAAAGFATAMGAAVLKASSDLSKMRYQSLRTGASVKNMKALGYAFEQVGGNAEQASQSVLSLHSRLRDVPGLASAIKKTLNVDVYDRATGKLRDQVDVLMDMGTAFRRMSSAQATLAGGLFGLDPDTVELLRSGEMEKHFLKAKQDMKDMGVDLDESAKRAEAFMKDIKSMWSNFKVESVHLLTSAVGDQLHELAEAFPKFIGDLNAQIKKFMDKVDADGWLSTIHSYLIGDRAKAAEESRPSADGINHAFGETDDINPLTKPITPERERFGNHRRETPEPTGVYFDDEGTFRLNPPAVEEGSKAAVPPVSYEIPQAVTTPTGEVVAQNVVKQTTRNSVSTTNNSPVSITQNITVNGGRDLARATGKAAKQGAVSAMRGHAPRAV